MKHQKHRSTCPINASLEVLGDRWSLLIVRDLMFGGVRTYKDFRSSDEGIATNILASRLAKLQDSGIVASHRDPQDGRSLIYRLTAKGVELAPVLMELSRWGARFEGGKPPHGILQAWEANPQAFLAEIRDELLETEAHPTVVSPQGG
jgi:DNA-binding HxlR family transcriptional regulator